MYKKSFRSTLEPVLRAVSLECWERCSRLWPKEEEGFLCSCVIVLWSLFLRRSLAHLSIARTGLCLASLLALQWTLQLLIFAPCYFIYLSFSVFTLCRYINSTFVLWNLCWVTCKKKFFYGNLKKTLYQWASSTADLVRSLLNDAST